LRNAVATQLQEVGLEQDIKKVCEVAAVEKKRLKDELAEERRKTQEANT
jgi:hypothetical protein